LKKELTSENKREKKENGMKESRKRRKGVNN
jgi:hypothetical protein